VADVAKRLSRSPRTLERQVMQAGLPPIHRVLRLSRLLRAAYRLERPGANVKQIAAELGYPSPHALAQRLHRHTGLTLTELRSGGFGGLSAYVQARLLAARTGASNGARGRHRRRRDGK
jgi:AraC-like DNA-binding protein